MKTIAFFAVILLFFTSCQQECPNCISSPAGETKSGQVFIAAGNLDSLIDKGGEVLKWNTANKMITAYQQHPERMKTVLCKKGKDKEVYLNGFKFDSKLIAQLLFPGVNLPDPKYTELMIIPSVSSKDVVPDAYGRVTPKEEQRFTMIVSGITPQGMIDRNTLINYFDPCPEICPKNMIEIFGYEPDTDHDPNECD